MPLYDYECRNCHHLLEDVKQSFKDEPLTKCPSCEKDELFRVVTGGIHSSVIGGTIGSQADKNNRDNKSMIQEYEHAKKEHQPKAEKPWHHKHATATNKEINKMTDKQKTKYIMEGRK